MEEISDLIDSQCCAWNRGDAEAFSRILADDCVFTNLLGQVLVGPAAFRTQYARMFETVYKSSRIEQEIDDMRLVKPDVALVDSSPVVHLPGSGSSPSRTVNTKLLQVLTRDEGKWKVRAFHNVEVRATPPTP